MSTSSKLIKPKPFYLKNHPSLNERWVQEVIADDPSILGLGDLILKDKERMQPRAGRLDLLLQDAESTQRFEVEIQLGATDEAHIIRCIEYWDIERKRYPQYEHCAVIIAEDLTTRFLNVISLLNGQIPLVAVQMRASQYEDGVALQFTKILDHASFGLVDDDEEVAVKVDRRHWEDRAGESMRLVDQLFGVVQEFSPNTRLTYLKHYIGLQTDGQSTNFAVFRPRKGFCELEFKLSRDAALEERIRAVGLDPRFMQWNAYRVKLTTTELSQSAELISDCLRAAWKHYHE
ncbi:MAG: hypothetical protein ACKVZJ_09210 [Phycisphaerales bacterium]